MIRLRAPKVTEKLVPVFCVLPPLFPDLLARRDPWG
jgi:hypothetical protein